MKTSIFDWNASQKERKYSNYVLPVTKRYEEEQINNTYFNNQNFKFTWSTSEEYGYDDFWTESNENSKDKGKLDVSALAISGMMINGILLSDILDKAGKYHYKVGLFHYLVKKKQEMKIKINENYL